MQKQYGRSNAKFELKADPKKETKRNKKVGGQLILSFSVMTDEEAKAQQKKEETEQANQAEPEIINVEEEMAKDARSF